MKHVFGPVPSRRLGLSLGIDLLTPKICTMDCLYCELGPTTDRRIERGRFVDLDEVLDELRTRLADEPDVDFVTFSGSGEPTLSLELGSAIDGGRAVTDARIAVLTNGSLMTDPDVRKALMRADVVVPSVDAVSMQVFQHITRPHPGLDPEAIIEAIATFTAEFDGDVWIETVIVKGMNDDLQEVAQLARAVDLISPARIHVNTVVRPPAVAGTEAVSDGRLHEIAETLGPHAEVIAPPSVQSHSFAADSAEVILDMAARRPVTIGDIASALGISPGEGAKIVGPLLDNRRLEVVQHGDLLYYVPIARKGEGS